MISWMYELNKLQVGQWLMDYMNSDETSCCYLSDGAEAQQLERYGQMLARRINGKIELMALDCNTLSGKTAKEAAAAYTESIEDVVKLMEEAGLVDARGDARGGWLRSPMLAPASSRLFRADAAAAAAAAAREKPRSGGTLQRADPRALPRRL